MLNYFINKFLFLILFMFIQLAHADTATNPPVFTGPYAVHLSISNKTGKDLNNVIVCPNPANNMNCRDEYGIVANGGKDLYYQDMPSYEGERTFILSTGAGNDFCKATIATKSDKVLTYYTNGNIHPSDDPSFENLTVPSVEIKLIDESESLMCFGTGSIRKNGQGLDITVQISVFPKSSPVNPALIPSFQSSYFEEKTYNEKIYNIICANNRIYDFIGVRVPQRHAINYFRVQNWFQLNDPEGLDQNILNKVIAQPDCEVLNQLPKDSPVEYVEVAKPPRYVDNKVWVFYAILCRNEGWGQNTVVGAMEPFTSWSGDANFNVNISEDKAYVFKNSKKFSMSNRAVIFIKNIAEPYCLNPS